MRTFIRGAWIWRGSATTLRPQPENALIEGGRIVAVGRDVSLPDGATVIDATDMLLMPGLVNAHFHSSVNHMKGRLRSLPLELFMLQESPSLEILRPSPREAYVRTMLGCLEMLRSGVTAVQDDAFFVPEPTTDIIDAVMQAYADSGIRARLALDQSNLADIDKLPFLASFITPEQKRILSKPPDCSAERLIDLYNHLITRWHGAEHGRLKAAVSCSAPQRVSPGYAASLEQLSRRHDLPFYAHILETKTQRALGSERFGGRSLFAVANDLGILSERTNVIHAIWADDADLDLLAARGAVVAHNPISNLRLGSGVMRFRALRDRGIPIALGTDEAIADDAVNMWSVAKTVGLIHNIAEADYERWPAALEILDCLIGDGHRAMRSEPDAGQIKAGAPADLALVDLDTLAFTPLNDVHRQLVYCENGSSVRLTMVQGRIVYQHGRVTTVDEKAIRGEARAIANQRRSTLDDATGRAQEFAAAYRAMYLKAAALDLRMNRWIGAC